MRTRSGSLAGPLILSVEGVLGSYQFHEWKPGRLRDGQQVCQTIAGFDLSVVLVL